MIWKYYRISDLTWSDYLYWFSLMSKEKRQRVNNFRFSDDRKRTVVGEMLARQEISDWCSISPESIRFQIGEFGKPYAVDLPVEFNISHSGDIVVCAIHDKPIGIDIEKIQQVSRGIVHSVCNKNEYSYVVGSDEINDTYTPSQLERFFKVWTYKEAYLKMIGRGIEGLDKVDYTEHRYFYYKSCFTGYCLTIVL